MRTLEHYVGIGRHLDGIESRLSVLARMFREEAPRGPLDEALIAAFNERAGSLAAAAAALLQVEHVPPPPEGGAS